MSRCKECNEEVEDGMEEDHARDVHPNLCDQKLEEYVQDSIRDAVAELFE